MTKIVKYLYNLRDICIILGVCTVSRLDLKA